METLISILIAIIIFAIVGYGLYLVCTRFFPNFPPALWICGVVLLILILMFANRVLGGPGQLIVWPWAR